MIKVSKWLPLLLVIGLLILPSMAKADSFTVYVGYADNLRASGFFPTPWLGGANVVSETPSGETLDTGAVRIDNTGATSITITGFSVTLNPGAGPIVFNFWNPLVIGAGQTGIFTQTFSYNFDSSDDGIFGGLPPGSLDPGGLNNAIGGCSSKASILAASGDAALCAANAPIVSFLENGNSFSATDSGQILNTGGYDFINGSADGNESINWNVIGSGANRGGTGVPEPSSLMLLGSGLLSLCGLIRRKS
jgi:hypothetical protein